MMLISLLAALSLQTAAVPEAVAPNVLRVPNTLEVWPGTGSGVGRWTNYAPMGKRPTIVATIYYSTLLPRPMPPSEIAIRTDVGPDRRTHFVAMRQTSERLEEVDSRNCDLAPLMNRLRAMPAPEPRVFGTEPLQPPPAPRGGHGGVSLYFAEARQSDGNAVSLSLSASNGEIATWVHDLFTVTHACWQPMALPEPLDQPSPVLP